MATEKMVYVKSNDYWGYDASEFDSEANFYTYSWTVPQTMYNDMDESNQSRLFPCALFYVQGVTDNHNFLTLTIDVDASKTNTKVRGMQGAKRRTLKFETGVPYAYSVGSITMKEAPAGSEDVSVIETEVKDGSATMQGVFNVSGFLTDASSIAEVVGLSTTSSAESFEATEIDAGGARADISDFYPQSSAEIGNEQSGRGVPVAYGSGSSQYVEPPVIEMGAEEIDAPGQPQMVSDFYPQSSAEIGNEQSGRGVPVAYGSGSSQYVEPPVITMEAQEIDAPGQPDMVSDFYPQSSAEIGNEQSGRGVPVAYGSGSSQYVEPPVIEMGAEVIDDNYMDTYSAMGEPNAEYDQGYNDQLDESLGMRDGAERNFRQSMKDRRDESKGTEKYDDSKAYSGVDTMDAQGYTDKQNESLGMRHRGRHTQSMKDRRDEAASMDRKYGMKRKYDDVMTMDADEMIYEGLPVIPDSYGTNSALSSGQGVPVWYGSAEHSQGYNDRDDESIGMRHRGSHSQSMKDRRDESKGMTGSMNPDHPYSDVSTMSAESRFDKLADKIAKQYEKKGMNPQEAREVGKKTAYKIGAAKYGKKGMAAKARAGMSAESLEDYSYQSNMGDMDSAGFTEGTVNPMEMTKLGAYAVPVIPNSVGTDSADGSGYGVPQWYGADTFGADRISEMLEEAAPPAKMGKKVGIVALVGLGIGAWMASRK